MYQVIKVRYSFDTGDLIEMHTEFRAPIKSLSEAKAMAREQNRLVGESDWLTYEDRFYYVRAANGKKVFDCGQGTGDPSDHERLKNSNIRGAQLDLFAYA